MLEGEAHARPQTGPPLAASETLGGEDESSTMRVLLWHKSDMTGQDTNGGCTIGGNPNSNGEVL